MTRPADSRPSPLGEADAVMLRQDSLTRPRVLDVCSNAGGAGKGYHDAGFTVVGIDIEPQPHYPYEFIQRDALTLDPQWIADNFDAVHASPPCQGYSGMSNCRPGLAATYPRLIAPLRELFEATGLPYVIENVMAAAPEMRDPVMLCGFMFGRELYRHRLFETSFPLGQPEHPAHTIPASKAGHWRPGTVMSVAGHVAPIAKAREVMEMDWTTREELAEAIPPYFAEYVGTALLAHLRGPVVASPPIICGPCWSDHCWLCEGVQDPPCHCRDQNHGYGNDDCEVAV